MQITLKDGYIENYAIVGDIVDGIEVEDLPEEELEKFEEHYKAYHFVNGKLVLDEEKLNEEPPTPAPTQLDIIEAQVTYTAMVTGTLLEV